MAELTDSAVADITNNLYFLDWDGECSVGTMAEIFDLIRNKYGYYIHTFFYRGCNVEIHIHADFSTFVEEIIKRCEIL